MVDLSEVKSQLEQPDVAAEAVFRGTNLSEGAQRLKDLKANKGPREFLDAYNMNKPFLPGAGSEALSRMGLERNGSGKKALTGDELARFDAAEKETKLIEAYLEKGPDSIRTGSNEDRAIIAYYDRAIALWPETAGLSVPDREAYIRKKLKDPRFLARVKEAYGAQIELSRGFENTAEEKESEYQAAKRLREAKDREMSKLSTKKGEVTAEMALYGESSPGVPNPKQRLLDTAVTEAGVAQTAIDGLDARISAKQQERKRKIIDLQAAITAPDKALIRGQIGIIDQDLADFESAKAPHQRKIATRDQSKQEFETLKLSKEKVEDDEFRVQGELDEAKYKEATARAIWEDAKNTRSTQEQKYVDGLQRVFYNAALEDISANIKENEEYRREELQKLKDQIGDQGAKTVLEGVKDRWTNVIKDGSGKIKKIELQKGKIEQDYYTLLNEGPQGMLRQMLTDAKDSSGNAIFNDTEIELKLNDPAFVAAAESEFVATLLRKRLQTSKITEGESNLLFDRFGDKIMDSALAKNDLATGMIDKLKEKNGFKGSRKEFMKKMMKNPKTYGGMAAILALLLGSPFILAGGMAAAGAYSTAVGAVA